jgi:AcrR family transcriptional regulator
VRSRRRRRSAKAAREEIIKAAERKLVERGPDGIRLQDVAGEVGVSHPAILHHFGSREMLIREVIDRAFERLEKDLTASFVMSDEGPPNASTILKRIHEALTREGHGRVMAWLNLLGHKRRDLKAAQPRWKMMSEALHALRVAHWKGVNQPSYQDTLFVMVLVTLALVGQSIVGSGPHEMLGLGADAAVQERFLEWFAPLLLSYLEGGLHTQSEETSPSVHPRASRASRTRRAPSRRKANHRGARS